MLQRTIVILILIFSMGAIQAQDDPVEDLLARMSLAEKIGQMTLVEKNSIQPDDVRTYFIGGVLSGGGGYPTPNTPESWAEMVNEYQQAALETPLAIPMIYGVDAVHGHNNVYGAVIFPQNVGLGAANNPELVEEIGRITAKEMAATGIYWDYAPVVAVPQDIRWGRAYEGYGENTELVTELGVAMMRGLQGDTTPLMSLATVKHYVGDGGAVWGTSPFGTSNIDRGVTDVDEETLRRVHLPPYEAAVEAGALSIMASYSSWDGLHMHAQKYLITDVLKGELGFEGFVVSDWQAVDQVDPDYYQSVVISINAGIDMNMVPYDYVKFIDTLTQAVENGDVPMERIDDAVRRILKVKFAMGLFDHPFSNEEMLADFGSNEHRAVARDAVSQSLVLLKNDNETLPLSKDVGTIFIAGSGADDIGIQSGGWTIEWQGKVGNITPGTTILEAIEATVSENTVVDYRRFADFEEGNRADVGIVVVSELPYAEWQGDNARLALSSGDINTIEKVRAVSDQLVVILISGRPLIITEPLMTADAFVAAWLPGTEGLGVTDVLFGDKPFTGKLPFTWPRNIEQLPFDFENLPTEGCEAPLFPFGYGLDFETSESPSLELAAECAPATTSEAAPDTETSTETAALIAPEGVYGETYYAPFPVSVTLDGEFGDWAGVPRVTVAADADPSSPAMSFAAAADKEYLYLSADVVDDNIVSGVHGEDYWNEDSVEFYINGTGDLTLSAYTEGVVQLTIPALNVDLPVEEAIVAGVQGATAGAQVKAVKTETGYAVEVAVPLQNDIWNIEAVDGNVIGFQVHLNGAATQDRSTKLIWSVLDTADQSYQNPGVFGQLIFHEVGGESSGVYRFASQLTPNGMVDDFERGLWLGYDATNVALGFVPWGDKSENTKLSVRQLIPFSEIAIRESLERANNVLAVSYAITAWGGFSHTFTDGANWISQDWSDFNALSFWLYGNMTGGIVQVEVFDNRNPDMPGDSAERWYYRITDDYEGWRQFTIPFDLFQRRTDWQPDGAPDDGLGLDAVSGYAFGFPPAVGAKTAYVDDVRLTNATDLSTVTSEGNEEVTVDMSIGWESREWELVWSDEFEGDAGTPVNTDYWTQEIGGAGWGNNEHQYYTDRVENASLDGNGNLAIVAREENPGDYNCHYGECKYTSARLISRDKVEFTYGRVEARLKLPRGQGIWPAFWMLGANFPQVGWPNSGEIDIMENVGFEPRTVHGTVHGPGYSGASGVGGSHSIDEDLADDFHVYAIDWDEDAIRWYFDGELYHILTPNDLGGREWVFDHDFFLLLNLAVGGNWPGYPDETTEFPQTYLIDYVRVYKLAGTE